MLTVLTTVLYLYTHLASRPTVPRAILMVRVPAGDIRSPEVTGEACTIGFRRARR